MDAAGPATDASESPSDANLDASLDPRADAELDAAHAPDADASSDTDASVEVPDAGIEAYPLGGKLVGLSGSHVVLSNGEEEVTLSADGSFVFPSQLPAGTRYLVRVKDQPDGQFCTVEPRAGTIADGPMTDLVVWCTVKPCRSLDDISWCRAASADQSCSDACTALGYQAMAISNERWFEAQSTEHACQRIADALGIEETRLEADATACARVEADDALACSTDSSCAAAQRGSSTADEAKAVCPCGLDSDFDAVDDSIDNCPDWWNPLQEDGDGDGLGDACDAD